MPTIAITHSADQVPRHFREEDLARLRAVAEVRVLGSNRFEAIAARLADADILLGSWGMPKLTPELLAAAPRLRAVCYAAGSVKGFATPEAYARGVIITTAMHANAIPVAQVTAALVTLANKNWFACQARIRAGGRERFHDSAEPAHPGNYRETVVGVVGFGAIGRLVVEHLQHLELTVLVADPYAKAEAVRAAGAELVPLLDLARRSHVLTLHAPDIPQCERMIDASVFRAMPDGATFINTARGRLVDEAALVAELKTGRISAHLDVTLPEPPVAGSELYSLPNCWLTPHRAGSSGAEIQRMGRYAVDECLAVLAGREPRYRVLESMLATMA
jgi:phosphoglycerate dehydrogenase-like enzyme